jgi:adenylate cyclase
MGQEIERKFMVAEEAWKLVQKPEGTFIKQGYLFNQDKKSCRVRISGGKAILNIKHSIDAVHRGEFEYEIPINEGLELLDAISENNIEKTRYRFPAGKHTWEVDVFSGANIGLIVAEIELDTADEAYEKPVWIAAEVTGDERYLNTNLAVMPFSMW